MRRLFPALFLALAACATQGAVGGTYHLDPNAGRECVAHCGVLDMDLTAVVVIMNNTGCVCEPRQRRTGAPGGGAAAAGGAAIHAAVQMQHQPPPKAPLAPPR